jgi:hypothetical protein
MASNKVICTGCGVLLDRAAGVCPECLTPVVLREPEGREFNDEEERPLLAEIRRRATELSEDKEQKHSGPLVYLSPEDEGRRFPLLTRAHWAIIAAAIVLLLLAAIIGFLLWRQQKRDAGASSQTGSNAVAAAQTAGTPNGASASPTPTPSLDDSSVLAAVKAAVTNYNPTGFSNYTLEIKEGIVTIGGNADTMPEKEGVENVVRPVAGVKAIVNNLIVRLTPVMIPAGLSPVEAKKLEDALRKGQDTDRQSREEADRRHDQIESQNEVDRRRREAAANKLREEEERLRREADEKLQREAADYERKLEDQRRLEAERRARAEQARLEASVLKSGTVAWSGIVDGVVEIIISGGSASLRNISGELAREVKSSFSAQVPRAPITVKLLSSTGRGTVAISQEPGAANGYTTIVRVDDSAKGGQQRYEFTLRWTAR